MNALRQRLLDWIAGTEDTGRHHPHTVRPVGPDYTPVTPAVRQANAPTYYADRHLPAGPDDRTGVLLNPSEVTQS